MTKSRPWLAEDDERLVEQYESGKSKQMIAFSLNRKVCAVVQRLTKLGIKRPEGKDLRYGCKYLKSKPSYFQPSFEGTDYIDDFIGNY